MTLTPLQCRMARAALDLSLRDLARQAGLSPGVLSRFENGQSMLLSRQERLGAVLGAMGIILLPEHDGDGVGIRLARTFRKGFIFDQDGRQIAAILGDTVIDAVGGHEVGTLRGEQVFALTGEALGVLQGVDVITQTGSLAEPALRAIREVGSTSATPTGPRPATLLLEG